MRHRHVLYIGQKSLTIDQIVNDTIEVSNYLIQRFSKEKIYLMGHSWGTIIGSKVVSIRSDLFHAYIGVGQIGSQSASKKENYHVISEKVEASGNE